MAVDYSSFDVPVTGGAIRVGRWGDGDTVIVASHGITANHLSWLRIAELVVERSGGAVSLVAVDHRGRAGSAEVPGPFGLEAHADDLMAVLDHVGRSSATIVGHSMGAFVSALAAERHPHRVDRLVLIDGGLPSPLDIPEDADVEAVVQSVIGPALDRLDQRWSDEDAYVKFFVDHPAFQPPNQWSSTVEGYVRYDAVATDDGKVRSSVNKEAVLVDGGAAIVDRESSEAIRRITAPTMLLWAPRGLLDQTPGLYTADLIDQAVGDLAHLEAAMVADTNHYTIAMGETGAGAVAEAILAH